MSDVVRSISTTCPSLSFNLRGHGIGKVNNNVLLLQTILYYIEIEPCGNE